jgi:hypothetical protein
MVTLVPFVPIVRQVQPKPQCSFAAWYKTQATTEADRFRIGVNSEALVS